MRTVQAYLLFVLLGLTYAAMLGVPSEPLAAAAYAGAWVSAAGLALELAPRYG